MAGLGGKNWAFEEEVSSSDVNGFLADQVVMRFADEATRTAGFGGSGEPTLAEGMVSYLDDANRVDVYNGSAWTAVSKVLQVVQTVKTDTFSTSSTSFVDVTGMAVSITPSATSSKILVVVNSNVSPSGDVAVAIRLLRDSTAIFAGDAAGNRPLGFGYAALNAPGVSFAENAFFLDSPNTTLSTTYKIQILVNTGTGYVNRTGVDRNTTTLDARIASSITAMEISG